MCLYEKYKFKFRKISNVSTIFLNISGDEGKQGPVGEKGLRGNRGFAGIAGPDGEPGQAGPKGPPGDKGVTGIGGIQGAQGESAVASDLGHHVVRHSQSVEVPLCPRNYKTLWEGYSLMYTVGNGHAHSQDLGDPGSCSRSFRYV